MPACARITHVGFESRQLGLGQTTGAGNADVSLLPVLEDPLVEFDCSLQLFDAPASAFIVLISIYLGRQSVGRQSERDSATHCCLVWISFSASSIALSSSCPSVSAATFNSRSDLTISDQRNQAYDGHVLGRSESPYRRLPSPQ